MTGRPAPGSEVRSTEVRSTEVRGSEVRSSEVRAEAGRLARRLEVARTRLDDDDDEVSDLLAPALARVTRLHDIARSLSDGTTSDAAAARAVRDVADTQPTRRPR